MSKTVLAMMSMLAFAPVHALQPQREVIGQTIVSTVQPKIRIDVPKAAIYLGADRWILGGYDDCEMHLFVEPDAKREIQRLYWVQFEAYVPQRPELAHTYTSPKIFVNGIDFHLDTWVQGKDDAVQPGSDEEHAHALIASKGYHLPADGMAVRLVHLPDAKKRHEVMIIYAEPLASTGFSAKELGGHGTQHARWAAISRALVRRALGHVAVQP